VAPKRRLHPPKTTMSNPHLPAEMLDHVADHLHDTKMRLGIVAWSPNHGSRVPESTCSPVSGSMLKKSCNRARRRFQILQPLLPVTPKLYSSGVPRSSRLQTRRRVVGSQGFLTSHTWRWAVVKARLSTRRRSLSSHSTDSPYPFIASSRGPGSARFYIGRRRRWLR
jgi:hypothetical protein